MARVYASLQLAVVSGLSGAFGGVWIWSARASDITRRLFDVAPENLGVKIAGPAFVGAQADPVGEDVCDFFRDREANDGTKDQIKVLFFIRSPGADIDLERSATVLVTVPAQSN